MTPKALRAVLKMENRFCFAAACWKRCVLAVCAAALLVLAVPPSSAFAAYEKTNSVSLTSCYGETQIDTAVAQSKAAFGEGSACAIIVGSKGWSDALAAAGLAGALDCPILYSYVDELPFATSSELRRLGVSEVLILGGEAVVSSEVEGLLSASYETRRIAGNDAYETQLEIFDFGRSEGLWSKDLLFVASGTSFYDALSVAPVAYVGKAPVFLIDGSLDFSQKQKTVLLDASAQGYGRKCVVVGGVKAVSEKAEGFALFTAACASGNGDACLRLAGTSMYDTNVAIANWAVSNMGMKWDGAAFASGSLPYDALAGSVLQGKKRAPILLVGGAPSVTVDAVARKASSIGSCVIFGGDGIIEPAMRKYISYSLGFGYGLSSGSTTLADGSRIWVDSSGVYRVDNEYYASWISKANKYSSSTDWLILVDTSLNRTVVFKDGGYGSWVVNKYLKCTTGASSTPTVKGQFTVGSRGLSFGSGYTCWYWTQFKGNYLFHSVLYNPGSKTSLKDGRLGINASHGCVRLAIDDAKWIYDNIPSKTKVVVY